MSDTKLLMIALTAQVIAMLAIEFYFDHFGWGLWYETLTELFNFM